VIFYLSFFHFFVFRFHENDRRVFEGRFEISTSLPGCATQISNLMAPGAAPSSLRTSRGSKMAAKRKTQTTGGKRGGATSSKSDRRRAIASTKTTTKKKKANKGGKENVESKPNAVASTMRAKASQRSRSAMRKVRIQRSGAETQLEAS